MAPSTEGGGGGTADHFRSIELCRRVLDLAPALLRSGGNLVMKVFEGEAYPELLRDTARLFAEVKAFGATLELSATDNYESYALDLLGHGDSPKPALRWGARPAQV